MTLLLKVEEQSNFKFVMSSRGKQNQSFPKKAYLLFRYFLTAISYACQNVV